MSLMDLNTMSPLAILTQYLSERRGACSFLTRDEMGLLTHWLRLSGGNVDELILIIEDVFESKKNKTKRRPDNQNRRVSIKSLDRIVQTKLQEKLSLKS